MHHVEHNGGPGSTDILKNNSAVWPASTLKLRTDSGQCLLVLCLMAKYESGLTSQFKVLSCGYSVLAALREPPVLPVLTHNGTGEVQFFEVDKTAKPLENAVHLKFSPNLDPAG